MDERFAHLTANLFACHGVKAEWRDFMPAEQVDEETHRESVNHRVMTLFNGVAGR